VDDLPVLEPRPFKVSLAIGPAPDPAIEREVYAVRQVDGNLLVLLNECTHLGCPVRWLPERRLFYCPCHRGYFNVVGHDVNGPPPRPLYRLRHRVENGVLFVSNEKLLTEEG
jgi:Rieske Fe-S protein